MNRLVLTICAAGVALVGAGVAQSKASMATLCVGGSAGCFSTIQAAVNAAHDGDTIKIGAGTFAGGVAIDVSVDVRGAGAGATIIKGGGPVLTIGKEFADTEPTVSISGVTITGGVNNSVPDHAVTQGGGVRIPQAFAFKTGATVTIRDSVITRNRVASQQLLPAGFCGPFDCSFASGGGINNDGALMLINTRVTDNQVGDPASVTTNASGGGIESSFRGTLTLRHSFVTGNHVSSTPPYGVGVAAGGINAGGDLTLEDSVVSGNTVDLSSSASSDAGPSAGAGGISVGGAATITRTIVHGNSVIAANAAGDILAFSGGIQDDGSLTLTDSTVDHNQVNATIPSSSTSTVIAAQGGLGIGGTATIRNSLINSNSVATNSAIGFAVVGGAGIGNFGQLTLERSLVIGNTGTANGAAGSAQGGGINNFTLGGPPPQLTLTDSIVTANRLGASPGITPQGGGLYTAFPITLTRTVIAGNRPDQCFGC